jgi:hypothetical protein
MFQNENKDYIAGDTSGNDLQKVVSSSRDSSPVLRCKAMAPESNVISSTPENRRQQRGLVVENNTVPSFPEAPKDRSSSQAPDLGR